MRIRTANHNHRRALARPTLSLEEKIYDEQILIIEELEEEEDHGIMTNMGWAVVYQKRYVEVSTKVYGYGKIHSRGYYKSGKIEHEVDL